MDGAHDGGLVVASGRLPPRTLVRARAYREQFESIARMSDDLLSVHLEAVGYDPNEWRMTALDLATGAWTAERRAAPVEPSRASAPSEAAG